MTQQARDEQTQMIVEELKARFANKNTRIEALETALTDCWGVLMVVQALREDGIPEKDWEGVSELITNALRDGAAVMGFTPEVMREALDETKQGKQEERKDTTE